MESSDGAWCEARDEIFFTSSFPAPEVDDGCRVPRRDRLAPMTKQEDDEPHQVVDRRPHCKDSTNGTIGILSSLSGCSAKRKASMRQVESSRAENQRCAEQERGNNVITQTSRTAFCTVMSLPLRRRSCEEIRFRRHRHLRCGSPSWSSDKPTPLPTCRTRSSENQSTIRRRSEGRRLRCASARNTAHSFFPLPATRDVVEPAPGTTSLRAALQAMT